MQDCGVETAESVEPSDGVQGAFPLWKDPALCPDEQVVQEPTPSPSTVGRCKQQQLASLPMAMFEHENMDSIDISSGEAWFVIPCTMTHL